ncbi:MAG: hypothetical protein C6W57_13140 [Caldibacillus debilis]|nr:MAG: hypothetical protein C6W57_13140 [Caldibacillus debilis]
MRKNFPGNLMNPVRLIFHPIGAGMYSEEQFAGWINEAKRMAVLQKSIVIGTSHSDGFYKNHRCSIPIACRFDEIGNPISIAKNDTGLRIFDTETKSVHVMSGCLKKRSDRLPMRRLLHTWHDGFQILFPDGKSEPENPLMGGKSEFENLAGIEVEK